MRRFLAFVVALAALIPAAPRVADALVPVLRPSQCLDEQKFGANETSADEFVEGRYRFPPFVTWPSPDQPARPDLTWDEDPFNNDPHWRFLQHNLRWTAALLDAWQEDKTQTQYYTRWRDILLDWQADNPPDNPPSEFSWGDHTTAVRAMLLACFAQRAPLEAWLTGPLQTHGNVLAQDSFYVGHGNHALDQSMGLFAIGCVLSNNDWMDIAIDRIATLAEESIDDQGASNEGSIAYAIYNYVQYDEARRRIAGCGRDVPPILDVRLPRLQRFIAYHTLPDGSIPLIGDANFGRPNPDLGPEVEYAVTRGESGNRPTNLSGIYRAGWIFGRSSWAPKDFSDQLHFVLRSGHATKIHAHDDFGHVSLYGFGRRLLEDSGFYAYGSALNSFFYRPQAHNLLIAEGSEYRRNTPPRLLASNRSAAFDAYLLDLPQWSGVTWRRRVVYSRTGGYLVVADHANAWRPRTFNQLWHLTPGAAPNIGSRWARTNFARGNVLLRFVGDQPSFDLIEGRLDPRQGFVAFNYGVATPAPVIQATVRTSRLKLVTVIVPGLGEPQVNVRTNWLTDRGFDLTITTRGRTERIGFKDGTFTGSCTAGC